MLFGKSKEVYTFKEEKKSKQKKEQPPIEEENEEPAAVPEPSDMQENEELPPDATPEPADGKKAKRRKKAKPPKSGVPFLKDQRKVGILLIVMSLLAILVASPLINYYTTIQTTSAVVAKADIPKGTLITEELLGTVSLPVPVLLPIHLTEPLPAVGQYAKTDIAKDELLTTPKLSKTLPYPNSYLYTLPSGKKAMSVTVTTLSSSLSGKLQADDIVSLYTNLNQKEDDTVYLAELLPELTYLRVLSVTNNDGYDLKQQSAVTDGAPQTEESIPATLTLLVDDRQARVLAGLELNGTIHAALVNRGDAAMAATLLKLQDDALATLAAEPEKAPEPPTEAEPSPGADSPADVPPDSPVIIIDDKGGTQP